MCRIIFIILLALLPLSAHAENPVYLTGMRVSAGTAKTVIVFDLTAKTSGVIKFIPRDKHLLLKFENTAMKMRVANARLGDANVLKFSAQTLPDDVVQFTFETMGDVQWTTEFIGGEKSSPVQMKLEIISIDATVKPEKKVEKPAEISKPLSSVKPDKKKLFTVVIDAGHGGKDTGAVGEHGTHEKAIVLTIAKKIAAKLAKEPGLRVVMTRKRDHYVPLRGRLNQARRVNADLFIAVHADAYFNDDVRGASVYALSQHGATNEASRWLAKQEKYPELDGIELDRLADTSRMVRSVLIDLAQTATIRDSLRLGNKVLNALDRVSSLHYRHVEQAPFVVLKSPDIPSILIETGFISNPHEEMQLRDAAYQDKLADAVCNGINAYIKKYANN